MKKTLKIGPFIYKVEEVENLTSVRIDGEESQCHGIIDPRKELIQIEKNDSPTGKQIDLWHEILHALCWQYGVAWKDEDIDRIAHGVVDVINSNKL